MAIPVLALLGQIATRVLTNPQTWKTLGVAALALAGGTIAFKIVLQEAAATVSALWWVVVLIVLLSLARVAVPIYLQERGKTHRAKLSGTDKHDE